MDEKYWIKRINQVLEPVKKYCIASFEKYKQEIASKFLEVAGVAVRTSLMDANALAVDHICRADTFKDGIRYDINNIFGRSRHFIFALDDLIRTEANRIVREEWYDFPENSDIMKAFKLGQQRNDKANEAYVKLMMHFKDMVGELMDKQALLSDEGKLATWEEFINSMEDQKKLVDDTINNLKQEI